MSWFRNSCGLAIALGSSMLVGCAASSQHNAPAAFQPEGSPAPLPADQMPDPIVIDANNRDGFVRTTIEPVIYDTRDVVPQRQITEPFAGDIKMIKHQLPQHSRDKSLKDVPDNARTLPVGQAVEVDRINQLGGTGFEAISQTEWSPPDPTLAVGPNHVVVTVNAAIAFYDKDTGNEVFSTHLGTPGSPGFFEPTGADSNFVFDPKCFYDHKAGRFVVVALETSGASWIDIAVSDDDDPNGIWYKYRTPSVIQVGSSDYWVDYPGFGFDDNAWYVTGNLFPLSGGGFGGQLFRIFDKTPMLNGDPVTFTDMAPNNGASLQVAQMFGDAPQCYFLSRDDSSSLMVWTINDPLTAPGLQRIIVNQLSNASGPSQDAPNPGGGEISTLDGRLMNVHYRDGNLYTAHGINGAPGITVARWYHIDVNGWPHSGSNPSLVQQGEVTGDDARHYFFPAIYSDRDHNVAMVTASSSPSEYASVRVSGRLDSDPLGTMSEPIELAIGDNGASGRWGDYLDIATDPDDDKTFWVVGMYSKSFGWQTYIDRFTVSAPCPADLDGNGELNFFDISLFLGYFNVQDPSADLNNDNQWNFFDISQYITEYNQGCP
ncbi:MAG: hypothetical protein CMJ35_06180 [Phycisphaerae bacterium]|nr:hypothetical protein [Phycisphaerae bacterium]MBM91185.1 hypothetical protein [Phycisphaerae bacterium]